MRATTLKLVVLAIPAAECSNEPAPAPHPFPSPRMDSYDPSTTRGSRKTVSPSPSLIWPLRQPTSKPSSMPTKLHSAAKTISPKASPVASEHFHFVAGSESNATAEVRCDFGAEATPYRTVKLPYYYQIEAEHSGDAESISRMVGDSVLMAIADKLCLQGEQIRRSLSEAALSEAHLIAAYTVSNDTVFNEYACPAHSKARSCLIVEGEPELIIASRVGDESGDHAVLSKAHRAVRLAFSSLEDEGTSLVNYIGNHPLSLASQLSQKAGHTTEAETSFWIIIIIIFICFVCGFFVGAVGLMYNCFKYRDARREPKLQNKNDVGKHDVESVPVSSTIDITSSASCDDNPELGSCHLDLEEELDWCRLIYLESLALSKQVPDASVEAVLK